MSDRPAKRVSGRLVFGLLAAAVLLMGGFAYVLKTVPDSSPSRLVPDEDVIRRRAATSPYLVGAHDVEGVLLDLELAAIVFRFRTDVDEASFWTTVEERAQGDGWTSRGEVDGVRTFVRRVKGLAGRSRSFGDELRIARDGDEVVVGHVSVDFDGAPLHPAESAAAPAFEAEVWPAFEAARRR